MANTAMTSSKAWPFLEARQLLKRIRDDKDDVIFQTGYGPSGLPHIGTFGEVARTAMVRHAFEMMSERPTKLICFSDDLDGFRKVPENVPNREVMREDLNLPLCKVRDPFNIHESFAAHNNARLMSFLNQFGFAYEFYSSVKCYSSGMFDEMLLRVLERFDQVMEIMLPSLGGISTDRKESYSPFLPISPKTGHVLQVPTLERNPTKGTIVYQEPDGEQIEIAVTGGQVKLQWKPDWAMRWAALGVDYEMYGKDLIPSAELGAKICRALGARPPAGMAYELFLDEQGQKISKSKGTGGVTVEEWLDYASAESMSAFMYQKPRTAKRLFAEIIPKTVDEYHQHLRAYPDQDEVARLNNPVWHIHRGTPPKSTMSVSYAMLLNLASAASAVKKEVLWGFVRKYDPSVSAESNPDLAAALDGVIRYFQRQILPTRKFRHPDNKQQDALFELRCRLWFWSDEADSKTIQKLIYALGRKYQFDPMKDWFQTMYEVLFGTSQGPRMGGFIELYGHRETAVLIANRSKGSDPLKHRQSEKLLLPILLILQNQPYGSATIHHLKEQLVQFLNREEGPTDALSRADSGATDFVESFLSDSNTANRTSIEGLVEAASNRRWRITEKGQELIELK